MRTSVGRYNGIAAVGDGTRSPRMEGANTWKSGQRVQTRHEEERDKRALIGVGVEVKVEFA
jgi:hypothetical protein